MLAIQLNLEQERIIQEEIQKRAFARDYVLVYHGGGCTGVSQCNDTHLHQKLIDRYQKIEQQDLF